MEKLNTTIRRELKAAKALAKMFFNPDAPLCQSDHYVREHFIPFEDDVEVLPTKLEDPYLWHDMGDYTGAPTQEFVFDNGSWEVLEKSIVLGED